jgi:cell division protein FtsI/penicillin-binding protein 2
MDQASPSGHCARIAFASTRASSGFIDIFLEVVGKTGTAQVAKTDGGGYEEGKTIGSFAGYAPRENPRFVVLIKVDNPKDVQWAESSAAPAFSQLMRFLLEYARIEPTEPL